MTLREEHIILEPLYKGHYSEFLKLYLAPINVSFNHRIPVCEIMHCNVYLDLCNWSEAVLQTLSVPELAPIAAKLPDPEKATERTAFEEKKI